MYEKLEQERIKLEFERIKVEQERYEKEYRFRCLEMARNFANDSVSLLIDAKKLSDFISSGK
jgi:hypothetical protein